MVAHVTKLQFVVGMNQNSKLPPHVSLGEEEVLSCGLSDGTFQRTNQQNKFAIDDFRMLKNIQQVVFITFRYLKKVKSKTCFACKHWKASYFQSQNSVQNSLTFHFLKNLFVSWVLAHTLVISWQGCWWFPLLTIVWKGSSGDWSPRRAGNTNTSLPSKQILVVGVVFFFSTATFEAGNLPELWQKVVPSSSALSILFIF